MLVHLREGGLTSAESALRDDDAYVLACWSAGNIAQDQARFQLALDLFDRLSDVYRQLVQVKGRGELANDLAAALVNRTLLLEQMEQTADALASYSEAIRLREAAVDAGMSHLLTPLLRTIRYRMMTLLDLEDWNAAVADMAHALARATTVFQGSKMPEPVQQELSAFFGLLRSLEPEQQTLVLTALGEWEADVRDLLGL